MAIDWEKHSSLTRFTGALHSETAVFAVLVEAKNESAASFYRHYEFRPLATAPMSFFLPVAFFHKITQRDRG